MFVDFDVWAKYHRFIKSRIRENVAVVRWIVHSYRLEPVWYEFRKQNGASLSVITKIGVVRDCAVVIVMFITIHHVISRFEPTYNRNVVVIYSKMIAVVLCKHLVILYTIHSHVDHGIHSKNQYFVLRSCHLSSLTSSSLRPVFAFWQRKKNLETRALELHLMNEEGSLQWASNRDNWYVGIKWCSELRCRYDWTERNGKIREDVSEPSFIWH